MENLLLMYPRVELDEQLARRGGELLADADRDAGGNSSVDIEDALIAAAAERIGEPVLTRNVGDFELFGTAIETY